MKKIYITTPLYYVNSTLTVGGAYTTVMADILARYHRLNGTPVYFLTGSDEHGQKIHREAKQKGITPQELANQTVESFQNLWKKLEITNDDFIRTTEERHKKIVQKIFLKLKEKDLIYSSLYEGLYCTPCETFLLETQLEKGVCPHCHREVEKIKEENYFFKLSHFQTQLEDLYASQADFVLPNFRKKEMQNRLLEGVRDISISRSVEWGVPIPENPKQHMWVWFDALINYISAIGYDENEKLFSSTWPANIHFIGKDILWFHAVLWPAMLMALDLPTPKSIFGHGWWTFGGEKISKSKDHQANPDEIIEQYGADSLRYFLAREIPLGSDGEFSIEALERRFNTDLANELGNLVSRSLSMLERYREGKIPETTQCGQIEESVIKLAEETILKYHEQMKKRDYFNALKTVWTLIQRLNKYIEEKTPWKLAKDPAQKEQLNTTLALVCAGIRLTAYLISPIMPQSTEKILHQLNWKEGTKEGTFKTELKWFFLPKDHKISTERETLFPKEKK